MKPPRPWTDQSHGKGGFMNDIQCLSHTKWDCKYHVVWIPKYRRKTLFGELRSNLVEVFHELARQKESKIIEGHLQPDHIHMLISIPPKYSIAQVIGYMKGRSAIHIARTYLGQRKKLQWNEFLGEGLLCYDSWSRWGNRTNLYQRPREGRPSSWTTVAI